MRLVSMCAALAVVALIPVRPPAAADALAPSAGALRPIAIVPFRRHGKLMVFDVRIGANPRRLSFTLDSGAAHTVIDSAAARALGLRPVGHRAAHGTGKGTIAVTRFAALRIAFDGASLDVAEPWGIDLGGVQNLGREDGLIGNELFRRYVVRLDQDHATMSLYEPATYRPARGATVVPLIAHNRWIYLAADLTAGDGTRARRELVIDLGSEDSVDDALAAHSPQRRSTVLGKGLGADYSGSSGVFARVGIGPYAWANVWGPAAGPAIGMEMLRRFTTTFDLTHRTLELVPNGHLRDPVPAPS
jgi:hypothetical protein